MKKASNLGSASEKELWGLEKEQLIATVLEQQKEMNNQFQFLKEIFADREKLIEQLKGLAEDQARQGYPNNSGWISKIVYTLQHENRPLRSQDLIRILEKKEKLLADHHNKAQYFSAFLSLAVSYGRVIQKKVKGTRGYYYLLPHWISEEGIVGHEFALKML